MIFFEFFFSLALASVVTVGESSFNKVINVIVVFNGCRVVFNLHVHFEVFNRFKQVCKVDSMEV